MSKTNRVHSTAQYGSNAAKLDDLYAEWSRLDAIADHASYEDEAANIASTAAYGMYGDAVERCGDPTMGMSPQDVWAADYNELYHVHQFTEAEVLGALGASPDDRAGEFIAAQETAVAAERERVANEVEYVYQRGNAVDDHHADCRADTREGF